MKNLFIVFVFVFSSVVTVYGQEASNSCDVKFLIFTSSNESIETKEGMYKYTSSGKSDTHKSPPVRFRFYSKSRNIYGYADYFEYDFVKLSKLRKVIDRDKLVIKEEPSEFLNSVNLIDMDVLFPKMTKDEFIKVWNSMWDKTVYFIDRSEIKNHKVKLYPVHVFGINLY